MIRGLIHINFPQVWESIREVVANPTANLTAALLLLGIVSLLLLVIVVVLLMFLAGEDEEDEGVDAATLKQNKADERARKAAAKARIPRTPAQERLARATGIAAVLIVPLIVVIALVAGYVMTSRTAYCLSCHRSVTQATAQASVGTTAAANPHKSVACIQCHEDSGVLAVPGNAALRVRDDLAAVLGRKVPQTAVVPADRCVPCHQAGLTNIVVDTRRGLRMSHKEPLAAGMTCTDCHQGIGHASAAVPPMSTCQRCHDGGTARADCKLCHTGDPGKSAGSNLRVFASINLLPVNSCGGCHSQATCDKCHGLRMPHSETFVAYDHERYAGFNKRVLCYRCHAPTFCGRCHMIAGGKYWGHGQTWITEHQTMPWSSGCGCHIASPYSRAGHFCEACHSKSTASR